MTLPALAFGLLCALLIGALFHLIGDGGLVRLLLYLGLSVAGSAAGQWLGHSLGWSLMPVGPLDLGTGAAGAIVCLGVGYWLSLVQVETSGSGRKV